MLVDRLDRGGVKVRGRVNLTGRASVLVAIIVVGSAVLAGATSAAASNKGAQTIGSITGNVSPGDVATSEATRPAITEAPLSKEEQAWAITQKPSGDAVAVIEKRFIDDFAYAYFTDTDELVIAFRSQAPAEAVKLLDRTGLPYTVQANVGFNAVEYAAQVDELTQHLATPGAAGQPITIGPQPDIAPGAILVTVSSQTEGTSAPGAEALDASSVKQPFSVVVRDSRAEVFHTHSYGRAAGTWLVDRYTGQGQCTSAFVVKSTSSTDLGVLTAGHCPTGLTYYDPQTTEAYVLDYRNSTSSLSGDVMFQRSYLMMDPWFHVDATTGRGVLEVRNPVTNEMVCQYGRGSNVQRCARVSQLNVTVQTDVGYIGHQGIMGATSSPGDSGGAIFGGNTAMGVLSSGTSTQTAFTLISFAQTASGTAVCYQSGC